MATITMQRDLVVELKKETVLNVGILSKLQEIPHDIARQVLNENALDKPTQNLFNHLSHYFACIIDPKASESLPWPLYDSKSERTYRNMLASFISNYSSKGLLTPVMTSYLVNTSSYKVTLLIFQMSQLAVQKVLESKMNKESQKKLYNDMTAKLKSQENDGFIEQIENETERMLSKFSNYLHKRKTTEIIAEKICTSITKMESKLALVNAQKFLDDVVDGFISKYEIDSVPKEEILKIKDIYQRAPFFDWWLSEVDRKIDEIESKWNEKVTPFLKTCKEVKHSTESLIARHTGEAEQDTYMIEYNHKTDEICTNELQNQVNSQQKYVLKNIIKDEKLNFPNLIRGFLIAVCYILRGIETGDEIYKFNEYLEGGKINYGEAVQALRDILKRITNAEARLEPSPVDRHISSAKNFPEIPLLPDLSDLCCSRELTCQVLFDSFTPISMSKHQFNLWNRATIHTFVRPPPKSLLTPFQVPREDFLKNLRSCRSNSDLNTTQNFHNMSIIPQTNRANETIAGCATGFTKEQLYRLLSTKKTTSSKKMMHNERSVKIHMARLFNESISSNESNGLLRSYSSPNLFENREVRSVQRSGRRKLSVMQESCSPLLEVSGIVALDKDSSCGSSRNQSKKDVSIPTIQVTTETPPTNQKFHQNLKEFSIDLDKQFLIENTPKYTDIEKTTVPNTKVTPQTQNTKPTNKTKSLEKIIKRFNRVRASVRHEEYNEKNLFRIITEEKDNACTANRILLPDLVSPNFSAINNTLDELEVCRKPRESLGAVLGVEDTFLDQFDLVD